MYIQKNLVFLKEKKNISIRKLQKCTGVSTSKYGYIKNGKTKEENLSILTVKKLADYFEVSLDDFVNTDLSKEK